MGGRTPDEQGGLEHVVLECAVRAGSDHLDHGAVEVRSLDAAGLDRLEALVETSPDTVGHLDALDPAGREAGAQFAAAGEVATLQAGGVQVGALEREQRAVGQRQFAPLDGLQPKFTVREGSLADIAQKALPRQPAPLPIDGHQRIGAQGLGDGAVGERSAEMLAGQVHVPRDGALLEFRLAQAAHVQHRQFAALDANAPRASAAGKPQAQIARAFLEHQFAVHVHGAARLDPRLAHTQRQAGGYHHFSHVQAIDVLDHFVLVEQTVQAFAGRGLVDDRMIVGGGSGSVAPGIGDLPDEAAIGPLHHVGQHRLPVENHHPDLASRRRELRRQQDLLLVVRPLDDQVEAADPVRAGRHAVHRQALAIHGLEDAANLIAAAR